MAPGAGLAKTDIIKDVIRVMGGNTFSHLVGGTKKNQVRQGWARPPTLVYSIFTCFALLCSY